MLLSELFDRLALGELSQHKYGKTGAILAADYPALIHQLNIGLSKLHNHFPLVEKEVVIRQYADITEYHLHSDFAVSNTESAEAVKYIEDTDSPFTDDILRIDTAYNGKGENVPLNDTASENAWFTPKGNKLQIRKPVATELATLIYRANHPKIATDADLSTLVDIPTSLEEALQAYIASRCFVSLGNQSSGALSSYFSNRYEEQIQYIERHNVLALKAQDSNTKLTLKGFI
jgi:hypothetical protein